MFPEYAIAYSDHSPGWEVDIAAVAMGADLIEKTITLDRTTLSCEHSFSIEPSDCATMVQSIRDLEVALGDSRRTIPAPSVVLVEVRADIGYSTVVIVGQTLHKKLKAYLSYESGTENSQVLR